MMWSRRFALIAAVAVLGLAACGDAKPSTTAGKAPAVIHVGASGGAGALPVSANASIATGDRMMAPFGDITYVFDGTFPDLGASAPAWQLPANPQIDSARLSLFAGSLGIADTTVRALPAEQGGGWQVGSSDYTGASLNGAADSMGSWWFNSAPPAASAMSPDSCGVAVPADANASNTTAAPPTTVVCPTPEPPANVPTQADALERAKQQFAALGYDTAAYEWEAYADQWGASANGYLLLDGHRSMLTLSMGFGAEGVVTYAGGHLAVPQAAGDYPIVDGATALGRLNDRTGKWGWFGGPMARLGMAIDAVATGAASSDGAGSDSAGSDGTGSGSAAVAPTPQPAPPATASAPASDSAPVATMPIVPTGDTVPLLPEPVTVHLTTATLDLTTVWAEDGTAYILPAYTFSATDGSSYTIVAVDESLLDLPDSAQVDVTIDSVVAEPVPVDSGAPVVPDVMPYATVDQAAVLVGLSVAEATKVAEGNGWLVRISTLDGQPQMGTMDYLTNRVNLAVTGSTVTGIDNIG